MNLKNILSIGVAIIVLMGAAFYLNGKNESDSSFSTQGQTSQSADAKYILSILSQMNDVKLEDGIFDEEIFKNLKDNTVTFTDQPSGRNNPFAPLGNESFIAQSSSSKPK